MRHFSLIYNSLLLKQFIIYQNYSQGEVNSQIFNKFLQNVSKYKTNLISLCKQIIDFLKQENKIRISHQNYNSEIIILAFFLRYCYPDKKITIFTQKINVKSWQKYFIDDKNTDPELCFKELLQKQQINIINFHQQHKLLQTPQQNIVIFDLINSQIINYHPIFLYKKLTQFHQYSKAIIYHSSIQQHQVEELLGDISEQFLPLQASVRYPIEIQYTAKDSDIKKHLIEFLKEDSSHPQKQDIIIFYKTNHLSNSSSKRFISKLNELILQQNLQSQIQFISSKNQLIQEEKNHIFIGQNTSQLLQWNYSYTEVFYVIDYGWNSSFKIDQDAYCYVENLDLTDLEEKTKRISFIGNNKVGKYVYIEQNISEIQKDFDKASEVMSYILKMIDLGLSKHINYKNPRIKACIQLLTANKIIQKQQNLVLNVLDVQLIKLCYQGIDPIQGKIIKQIINTQKDKQQKIMVNLLFYVFAVLKTRGNLRQSKENMIEKAVIKPSGIWRRTGYLHSCLQILTKAELIESGINQRKSYSRKKTKYNQAQYEAFGNLFEIIVGKKIEFQDMEIEDLVREYYVNEQVFTQMRQKADQMREIFNIQQTNIKLDKKQIQEILQKFLSFTLNSIGVYSGSRRVGYTKNGKHFFSHKDSLISQLNEFPSFLYIMRYFQNQGKKQILMCNSLSIDTYMSIFGQLLTKNQKSYAEYQIQFHGISTSVFNGLSRNNSFEIKRFEQENKCHVQPNEQMATITICCKKQEQEKIKQSFDDILTKIKQKFVNHDKIVQYLGNTNIRISNGGQIKQVIKDNYIDKCYLNNLDLEVTKQDLKQLFDEFFDLKDIQILPAECNKFSKSAIISFNSQKDYYRFYSYYHQCKYLGRFMEVKPIQMKAERVKKLIDNQNSILFKWYVWKSHQRAIIFFKQEQHTQNAYKALTENPNVDGNPVKFQIDKKKLIFSNLDETVDEIFLEKIFGIHGKILDIQILKTPIKQPTHPQVYLDEQIRAVLNIPKNQDIQRRYVINKIEKHKNGLRKCKVIVRNIEDLNALINSLNQVKKRNIGQGRLYAESWFTKPIPILYPSAINLYTELMQLTINQALHNSKIHYSVQDIGNNHFFMILKSPLFQTLQYISKQYECKLSPFCVNLTSFQKDIILSQIGIDNLIDIQQKYLCKLIVNSVKKQLEVICLDKDSMAIIQQIKARVEDKFFYRISLNNKSYKKLVNDKQKLQSIKQTYYLSIFEIQDFSKTLVFEGSAHHVQNALNYMMHLIESFTVPEQQLINSQFCLICYTECCQPYRLQNCSHKFCFSCLDQYLSSTLGDMSMFPIKCPHCLVEVTIHDLQSLVDKNSWVKLLNMSANQFVGKNSQLMTFCYTAGCNQINMIILNYIDCELCNLKYCIECKQRYHNNLTCEQAKIGTDELFKKYMEQNDVRVCPNNSCKMPIIRLDGCFRVTCSRCNKSMCFKCPKDKMIAYDDYNDCYKHLNDAHGGYW